LTPSHFWTPFPHLHCKPIGSLQQYSTLSTDSTLENIAKISIHAFLIECRLTIFQSVIRLDYIGRHNFALADHLHMTVKCLCLPTLDFLMRGKIIHGNPDMLFSQYLALTPLLPASHTNIWGINLFTQFLAALGEYLTHRITCLPHYIDIHESTFDLTTMITKDCQMSVRKLRSLSVKSYPLLQDDHHNMPAIFCELSHANYAANHIVDSSVHTSATKATI
jgi:hypothetical protein